VNTIRLDGLKNVVSTSDGLGLKSSADILRGSSAEEGVSIEDANELMLPDSGDFATIYDSALNTISSQRAVFGALQSRLNKAIDYIDVYHENIAAAKSNISDTDYAMEVVKMTQSAILTQATSGLMSQINFESGTTLSLLNSLR
jgi:flagellin